MAAKRATKQKQAYYSLPIDKFLPLLSEIEIFYTVVAEKIKELTQNPCSQWDKSAIPMLFETYLLCEEFRDYLNDKINNPTVEEVELALKNGIKDLLFSKEEIDFVQTTTAEIENYKGLLINKFCITFSLN